MTDRKRECCFAAGIFGAALVLGMVVFWGNYRWNERRFYDRMAAVVSALPGSQADVMKALKDMEVCDPEAGKEILRNYGYEERLPEGRLYRVSLAGGLLFAGGCTAAFLFFCKRERRRLQDRSRELADYLREVEDGNYMLHPESREDAFSGLEDAIYKTVLALRESRERLQQEKERLAVNMADISHQFKTPLTSLSLLGEVLLRRIGEGQEADVVRNMARQTERLADLSAALLTLSRADAGVLPFQIRKIPVSELLDCALAAVMPLLEEKGQRLVMEGDGQELFLSCDLGWTGEALGNLLKNASEHGPENSKIRIRVWDNPVYTGIEIGDQGPGFSEKDLRHLFDRFYRGEGAGRNNAGIGLALARTLIESQKGEIRARNRKEAGAEFIIKFYKNI